jgi:hypothetical protein
MTEVLGGWKYSKVMSGGAGGTDWMEVMNSLTDQAVLYLVHSVQSEGRAVGQTEAWTLCTLSLGPVPPLPNLTTE